MSDSVVKKVIAFLSREGLKNGNGHEKPRLKSKDELRDVMEEAVRRIASKGPEAAGEARKEIIRHMGEQRK